MLNDQIQARNATTFLDALPTELRDVIYNEVQESYKKDHKKLFNESMTSLTKFFEDWKKSERQFYIYLRCYRRILENALTFPKYYPNHWKYIQRRNRDTKKGYPKYMNMGISLYNALRYREYLQSINQNIIFGDFDASMDKSFLSRYNPNNKLFYI